MKLLVIEDDRATAERVRHCLTARTHTVDVSPDGADGSFLARSYDYDAIVLDYALPKKDGFAVCREVRAAGKSTPIIFVSATDDPETKVAALGLGADDYMCKPFSLEELGARIDAVTRRPATIKDATIVVSDLRLDASSNNVERGGRSIHLTRKEFQMLHYFMRNRGVVLSRAQLMERIWTADSNPFSNTVEAHIRNLRKKLCMNGEPDLIRNLPGRGYVLNTPESLKKL